MSLQPCEDWDLAEPNQRNDVDAGAQELSKECEYDIADRN